MPLPSQSMTNRLIVTVALVLSSSTCRAAQMIDTGSDGHDGVFTPAANTVIDMADHPDGVYHYTDVNIPANVAVRFIPNSKNTPVTWLIQGDCVIAGAVDVSGLAPVGQTGGIGGPGGHGGGDAGTGTRPPRSGDGPGGGASSWSYQMGGNGSFGRVGGRARGDASFIQEDAGPAYGNQFLLPLLGGSGGGGGWDPNSSKAQGGGGGGGAILIASSKTIAIIGEIKAVGADSGPAENYGAGGGGSGGAIRLLAAQVAGNGILTAAGGAAIFEMFGGVAQSEAGEGRIRIDAFEDRFIGDIRGKLSSGYQPIISSYPNDGARLTVASIGGVPVSASPTGTLATPDAVLGAQQVNPVPIVVRCVNLPLNTPVTVSLKPRSGSLVRAVGYNNTGSFTESTATVLVWMPRGGGLVFATTTTSD